MSNEDLELLITLDYPWYAPDEDTFHPQLESAVTHWPGQSSTLMSRHGDGAEVNVSSFTASIW
jgi:hypothetical protein